MDDILRAGESVASAQYANSLVEDLFKQKSLSFNMKKSQFILMGSKSSRKKLRKDLEKTPLKLCDEKMRETNALKYLGDFISINLEESVHETVTRRIAIAKRTTLDIRAVIEDTRAEKLGAMSLAFELWSQSVSPMIYCNAESWISVPKKTLRVLDGLFQDFSQKIWRVCSRSPIPNSYWVTDA